MNIAYLKAMPIEEFILLAAPYLEAVEDDLNENPEYGRAALEMARERIHSLPDIARTATYFFTDDFPIDEAGRAKHLTPENLANAAKLRAKFAALSEWNAANIENAVRALSEELGSKSRFWCIPRVCWCRGRRWGRRCGNCSNFWAKSGFCGAWGARFDPSRPSPQVERGRARICPFLLQLLVKWSEWALDLLSTCGEGRGGGNHLTNS